MRRLMFAAAAAAVLAGCGGGDDSTGPEAADYPAVAGSYRLAGTFDGLPDVSITGTATLGAPDADGDITGTVVMTIPAFDIFDAPSTLTDATVTESGTIAFSLDDGGSEGVSWRFTGQVAGNSMSGRHTISDATIAASGDWTLVRQTSSVAAARAPAAVAARPAAFAGLAAAVRARAAGGQARR